MNIVEDDIYQTFFSSKHREFGIEWCVEVRKDSLDNDYFRDDDDDNEDDSSGHDEEEDDNENYFDDEDEEDEDESDNDFLDYLGVFLKAKSIDNKIKK